VKQQQYQQQTITVGIDVAKAHLDMAVSTSKGVRNFSNDAEGHAKIVAAIQACPSKPMLIVMEATGGYEKPLAVALQAAGLPVAVVNPKRSRDYAKSQGWFAKTDKVDARLLAKFGAGLVNDEENDLKRWLKRPPDARREWLTALVTRRRQLVTMAQAERQRMELTPKDLLPSIGGVIETLQAQIESLNGQIEQYIGEHYAALNDLLQSVPGIGPQSSAILIGAMPELGELNRRKVASLAGVAPYPKDSGNSVGRRVIQGGRFDLRRALYMAALVASKHNPTIRAFYKRLLAAGKLKKVALVACMRKLLTILNAMVRDGTPWNPAKEPTPPVASEPQRKTPAEPPKKSPASRQKQGVQKRPRKDWRQHKRRSVDNAI
jgi:transposase